MTKILFYSIISLLILSCNAIKPKKVDTRETPINAQERAKKNIKVVRPNLGLHPKFYEKILGKKALKNLNKATALKKSHYIK